MSTESQEIAVLSGVAGYQTVSMTELMALTPGMTDTEVLSTVADLQQKQLLKTQDAGSEPDEEDEMFVSLTSRAYDYLSSQHKIKKF